MNELFKLLEEQAEKMKGLAIFISRAPSGDMRVQVNWTNACKRGGDMILAFAEESNTEEAFKAACERLKKWIEEHKEEINERIRYM